MNIDANDTTDPLRYGYAGYTTNSEGQFTGSFGVGYDLSLTQDFYTTTPQGSRSANPIETIQWQVNSSGLFAPSSGPSVPMGVSGFTGTGTNSLRPKCSDGR